MKRIGIEDGEEVEGRRMRRLGGWGAERENWLEAVKEMVRSE